MLDDFQSRLSDIAKSETATAQEIEDWKKKVRDAEVRLTNAGNAASAAAEAELEARMKKEVNPDIPNWHIPV